MARAHFYCKAHTWCTAAHRRRLLCAVKVRRLIDAAHASHASEPTHYRPFIKRTVRRRFMYWTIRPTQTLPHKRWSALVSAPTVCCAHTMSRRRAGGLGDHRRHRLVGERLVGWQLQFAEVGAQVFGIYDDRERAYQSAIHATFKSYSLFGYGRAGCA
jgi:hypothetical protein